MDTWYHRDDSTVSKLYLPLYTLIEKVKVSRPREGNYTRRKVNNTLANMLRNPRYSLSTLTLLKGTLSTYAIDVFIYPSTVARHCITSFASGRKWCEKGILHMPQEKGIEENGPIPECISIDLGIDGD